MAEKVVTSSKSNKLGKTSQEESDLSCQICLDQYKDPKLLPCGHSFCLTCLKNIVFRSHEQNPRTLSCPSCRDKHCIPEKGVAAFITDFTVLQEIEHHSQLASLKQRSSCCGLCETVGETEAFCADCDSFLCSDCARAHERMKTFANHQVSPTKGRLSTLKPKAKTQFCHNHPQKAVNMYCATCEMLICNECISTPLQPRSSRSRYQEEQPRCHSKHTVHSTSAETLESFQMKVTGLVNKRIAMEQKLQENMQDIDTQVDLLKDYPQQLRKAINEMTDACIATLESNRNKSLASVNEFVAQTAVSLQKEKKDIPLKLNSLKSQLRYATKALDCRVSPGKTMMLAKASSLLTDRHLTSSKSSLALVIDLNAELQQSSKAFVQEIDRIGRFCLIKIVDGYFWARLREKCSIKVCVKATPIQNPEFRIAYGLDSCRHCPVDALYSSNHTWKLEFTPCCIGKHQIEMKILGRWYTTGLYSPSFRVDGNLKKGDLVRQIPFDPEKELYKIKPRTISVTGKVTNVKYSKTSRYSMYDVTIVWGHDTEDQDEETTTLSFSNEASSFPLELVL